MSSTSTAPCCQTRDRAATQRLLRIRSAVGLRASIRTTEKPVSASSRTCTAASSGSPSPWWPSPSASCIRRFEVVDFIIRATEAALDPSTLAQVCRMKAYTCSTPFTRHRYLHDSPAAVRLHQLRRLRSQVRPGELHANEILLARLLLLPRVIY